MDGGGSGHNRARDGAGQEGQAEVRRGFSGRSMVHWHSGKTTTLTFRGGKHPGRTPRSGSKPSIDHGGSVDKRASRSEVSGTRHIRNRVSYLLGLGIWIGAASGCAPPKADADELRVSQLKVEIEFVATLEQGTGPILASANSLSSGLNDAVYIGDGSDRQIKVYGQDRVQAQPIGSPGHGPGEFATLLSTGLLGDSVFGWDMRANRLSIFDGYGRYVRGVSLHQPGSPRWSRIRAMDDSLLVASGWVLGAHDRPLVEVFDREGLRVGRFMDMSNLLSPPDPEFLQHTWVFADGSDGVVFPTIHGVDTIMAHTPGGRFLGGGRIELTGFAPVLDLKRLIEQNNGTLRRPDGGWAQDRHYGVTRLVALGHDLVAVQFELLDFERGQDLLEDGGPVVILRLDTDGVIRSVEQLEAPGALLGRKNQGEALLLRWSGAELGVLELFQLTVHL